MVRSPTAPAKLGGGGSRTHVGKRIEHRSRSKRENSRRKVQKRTVPTVVCEGIAARLRTGNSGGASPDACTLLRAKRPLSRATDGAVGALLPGLRRFAARIAAARSIAAGVPFTLKEPANGPQAQEASPHIVSANNNGSASAILSVTTSRRRPLRRPGEHTIKPTRRHAR